MSLDRTTILRGPCKVAYDSQTFYSRGDVTVTFSSPLFDKSSAAYGRHGQGVSDKRVTVSFTPVTYTAAEAAVLWPHASTAIGASIYGSTDTPLVITPISGQPLTVANAAVTGMPDMVFSPIQNFWAGDVTFTGLLAISSDPALVASYYAWGTVASGVNIGSEWTPGNDIYLPFSGTYNGVTFEAMEGFRIAANLNLADVQVDALGTVDMTLSSHNPTLTFRPVGKTEAEVESLLNFGLAIGAGQTAHDFVLAGPDTGDLQVTLAGCTPGADQSRAYGNESDRIGEVTMEAQRTITGGTVAP
jgi:hypothetical protein